MSTDDNVCTNSLVQDVDAFLGKAEEFIGGEDSQGSSPTFSYSSGANEITFGIEEKGYSSGEDKTYFVTAELNGNGDKYFSRGYLTAEHGHHVDFALTHNNPRGLNIRQGVLIEMRNLVNLMKDTQKLSAGLGTDSSCDFLKDLYSQLEKQDAKLDVHEANTDNQNAGNTNSLAKLKLKGNSKEEAPKWNDQFKDMGDLEDTIGESFMKAIGNKTEKPEKDNTIDDELKSTEVYVIRKKSFLGRMTAMFRGMFGDDKDMRKLEDIFNESFSKAENSEKNEEVLK